MDRREHPNLNGARAALLLLLAAAFTPAPGATLGDDLAPAGADELLPADEAFILGAERQADATIVLHWAIADGYYLYRDRSAFALENAGEARLGEPRFAPAETQDDPFFGRVAIYREEASVRLPLEGEPPPDARLRVTYQGCNEPVGVCYPPVEKTLSLASIDPEAAAAAAPPMPVVMALAAMLLILAGVQLGALSPATGARARLLKGVGTILLLYGALLLVGAAGGGQSLLQPLRGVVSSSGPAAAPVLRPVDGAGDLRGALAEARRDARPVMLDVYADWCAACQKLEASTFPDPRVREALGDTLLLRADVGAPAAGDRALLQRFDLHGPPALLFFGADGVERRGHRVVGYMAPAEFAAHVRRALPEAGA